MTRMCGVVLVGLMGLFSCKENAASASEVPLEVPPKTPNAPSSKEPRASPSKPAAPFPALRVGDKAPEFELFDLDGHQVRLSQFKGKVIVLEWFNPACPFVRAAHTKGSLVDAAERLMKEGVVYLAINSGAPGKQGHGVEANRALAHEFHIKHPILLDESGTVGRAYGATNTPHIFIIDQKGGLAYRGAVDNSPDGEGEAPEGGKLIRYMEEAARATLVGKPVAVPETKAYGCSVKYASPGASRK